MLSEWEILSSKLWLYCTPREFTQCERPFVCNVERFSSEPPKSCSNFKKFINWESWHECVCGKSYSLSSHPIRHYRNYMLVKALGVLLTQQDSWEEPVTSCGERDIKSCVEPSVYLDIDSWGESLGMPCIGKLSEGVLHFQTCLGSLPNFWYQCLWLKTSQLYPNILMGSKTL